MIPHAFPVSDIQQGPSDMKLQVETISLSEAIEAQGPHRRCGGRDIACAISARARRSFNLGVDTHCCFGVFSLDLLQRPWPFCLGKSVLPDRDWAGD